VLEAALIALVALTMLSFPALIWASEQGKR